MTLVCTITEPCGLQQQLLSRLGGVTCDALTVRVGTGRVKPGSRGLLDGRTYRVG
jgi:hypothetical protein